MDLMASYAAYSRPDGGKKLMVLAEDRRISRGGRSGTQQTAFYIIPHSPTSALVRRRSYCTYNYRAGFRSVFFNCLLLLFAFLFLFLLFNL